MARLLPASLWALVLPLINADVEFTSPAAGANVPVGTIEVQWEDSGDDPSLLDLTQYTLSLVVGGNDKMLPIATFESGGKFTDGNSATGTIPAGIAGSVKNGFFFKIESASVFGGTVVNYSPRFSIDGLTGSTLSEYRIAAEQLNGSTEGPGMGSNSTSPATTSSATSSASEQSSTAGPSASSIPTERPSEADTSSSGLSIGMQAGIGVASAAIGGLIVGLITWFVLRRKGRKRDQQSRTSRVYMDGKAEMSGETLKKKDSTSTTSISCEMSPHGEMFEMNGAGPVPEMEAGIRAHETEGSLGAQETEGSATAIEMEGSTVVHELPAQRFSKGPG